MVLRTLLSAITLFGGHVVNRRPERILQVSGLLATLGIAYSALPSLVFRDADVYVATRLFNVSALVLLGIALLSAALTWKDAKSLAPPALSPSSRVAGAAVSLFGFILVGFATAVLVSSIGTRASRVNVTSQSRSQADLRPVFAIANLGGDVRYDELRRAPKGPHPLRGRIVMAGKPIASAMVELKLNNTFRSDTLVTNKRGEFEIFLPAGPWSLNEVSVRSWNDAPKDVDLLLFSGHEPRRDAGYYSPMRPSESPVRIDLPMRADVALPTFELRASINMQWPLAGESDPSKPTQAPGANAATDAIRWSSVPGATEYEIQVRSVERKEGTMMIESLLVRRQSGTELALASLPQQPRDSTEPSEYSVLVYAFDAAGNMLSKSIEGFNHHAFTLAGETRIAKEKISRSPSPDDDSQYLRNAGRLSLVASLLEYEQLDAARAILKEVGDSAPPGRKAAMQGAIEAMSGNCAAAIPLLDQADKEGGLGCAPAKYRAMCSSTR